MGFDDSALDSSEITRLKAMRAKNTSQPDSATPNIVAPAKPAADPIAATTAPIMASGMTDPRCVQTRQAAMASA